jgi:hypothetical protein
VERRRRSPQDDVWRRSPPPPRKKRDRFPLKGLWNPPFIAWKANLAAGACHDDDEGTRQSWQERGDRTTRTARAGFIRAGMRINKRHNRSKKVVNKEKGAAKVIVRFVFWRSGGRRLLVRSADAGRVWSSSIAKPPRAANNVCDDGCRELGSSAFGERAVISSS